MSRANVLFVDDDSYFLKGIERTLRPYAAMWDMSFVENGRYALKIMSDNPPDVVVSDINMPEMSGDILLGKVKHRFPRTRHIVLSGQCDQSSAFRLIGGDHQFLAKPCDPDLLISTIQAAIANGNEPLSDEGKAKSESGETRDTVLLIENSQMQGRLIAERIRALADVKVTVAHTFADAKRILDEQQDRIFMCTTAMVLNDASGTEVLDFVLSRNLPCIVLTSSHDEGLRSRSLSKPILDYFLKNSLYQDDRMFDLIRRTYENGPIKVLVVDDSATDRRLVADLLRVMNFRVVSAASGDEALSVMAENPDVRIVVTDNEMPGLSGVDFTHQLRQAHGNDEMIVIGMSSAADVTARFIKAGCNDFIKKPFSAEEFYCRVQQNVAFFEKYRETKRLNARITHEKAESEKLLLNILPERVASELKACGQVAPVKHDSVSVLFADFVGFTKNSERLQSSQLVEILGYYYGQFDDIAARMNLEKIKTIGDCYMCVAGLSGDADNHATAAVEAARAMLGVLADPPSDLFCEGMAPWQLRIGIHSGPVTSGVVGFHKFAYDIWGDTVNTAARIEAAGQAGRINVSAATRELLGKEVRLEPRGSIAIKGKSSLDMFFAA